MLIKFKITEAMNYDEFLFTQQFYEFEDRLNTSIFYNNIKKIVDAETCNQTQEIENITRFCNNINYVIEA